MERLQKYISKCGVASRRKAEELILNGKVKVNGVLVKELGTKVDCNDVVMVNGEVLKSELKEYYVLYKPRGVISAVSDDKGRKTVRDLVKTEARIYPVGRLDYDTTGIILLTNDGDLSNLLTHPSRDVSKEYLAKIKGFFKKEDALKLTDGVLLNGVRTKKALFKLKRYDKKTDTSYVRVIITEGRNHQIKDMFDIFGYDVLKLKRERYAFLDLSNLKSGEYRKLSVKEVKQLYSLK
jgi:23S rRNA pseudouridine2605 synthase